MLKVAEYDRAPRDRHQRAGQLCRPHIALHPRLMRASRCDDGPTLSGLASTIWLMVRFLVK
jgi:hypothetical protein